MDIRIGITHAPRELAFDTDQSVADIDTALAAARQGAGLLHLTDTKGQEYLIAAEQIAYIEFGSNQARPVGFVS